MNKYSLSNSRQLSCAKLILPSLIGMLIGAKLGEAAYDPNYDPNLHGESEDEKDPELLRGYQEMQADQQKLLAQADAMSLQRAIDASKGSAKLAERLRRKQEADEDRDFKEACRRSLDEARKAEARKRREARKAEERVFEEWKNKANATIGQLSRYVDLWQSKPDLEGKSYIDKARKHISCLETLIKLRRTAQLQTARSDAKKFYRDCLTRTRRHREALQKKAVPKNEWSCGICTFLNTRETCEMCGSKPPASVAGALPAKKRPPQPEANVAAAFVNEIMGGKKGKDIPEVIAVADKDSQWKCDCGHVNKHKFNPLCCGSCGFQRPASDI